MVVFSQPYCKEKINQNGSRWHVMVFTYMCPKPGCCRVVEREDKTGYSNPFAHLKSCYGGKDQVLRLYKSAWDEADKTGASVSTYLKSLTANEKDNIILDWIKLLVDKQLPMCFCEDFLLQAFSEHNIPMSQKTIKETIFKLVGKVEKKIGKELQDAPIRAIMHDGWTKLSDHYFALYACYNWPTKKWSYCCSNTWSTIRTQGRWQCNKWNNWIFCRCTYQLCEKYILWLLWDSWYWQIDCLSNCQ